MVASPVLLAVAFATGVATFFSPCSVALVPAYVAWFVGLDGSEAEGAGAGGVRAGVRFGVASAGGILAVFLLFGALVLGLRAVAGGTPAGVGEAARTLAVGVGVVLVVLGGLMLVDRSPSVSLPLRAPRERTVSGMVGFGAVFALGSLGCSLPLFLAVSAQALSAGPVGGVLTFLAYGLGVAVLMLAVAVLLTVARERTEAWVREAVPRVRVASGVLLVAAGGYVLWYYLGG